MSKNIYNVSLDKDRKVIVTLNDKSKIIDWPFEHIKRKMITIVIFNSLVEDHRSKSVWKIYDDGRTVKTSGAERKLALSYTSVLTFEFKPESINSAEFETVGDGSYIVFQTNTLKYAQEFAEGKSPDKYEDKFSVHEDITIAESTYNEIILKDDTYCAGIARIIKGTEPHWL